MNRRFWMHLVVWTAMITGALVAQTPQPAVNQSDEPLLKAFRFRSIGPAHLGGRLDDIAVVENNPALKHYRHGQSLSQQELAVRLSVDPGTLARWERAARTPTGEYLKRAQAILTAM